MAKYCIDFDTKDMAPHIVATQVTLDKLVMRDMGAPVAVNLPDDPQYPKLERYVMLNHTIDVKKVTALASKHGTPGHKLRQILEEYIGCGNT